MAVACMHSGMGGYGWLFQLLIFIVFFAVVWWLLRSNRQEAVREKPLDILKRRLAEGEITRKEFEELKRELE